jgi:hypothetical protein
LPGLLAVIIDERILQYFEQPCLGIGSLLVRIDETICLHKGLLDQVVGIVFVEGEVKGEIIQGIHQRKQLPFEQTIPPCLILAVFTHAVKIGNILP